MWAAIASFIVGGVGWWLAKFLFEAWKEIADYRREAQEALILYGNLAKTAPPEERATASGAFRRIGAALISRHLAAYPWVQWWCRRVLAWDVHNAGAALIGVGTATQFDGFSMTNISPSAMQIPQYLRLPVPDEAKLMDHLFARSRAADN